MSASGNGHDDNTAASDAAAAQANADELAAELAALVGGTGAAVATGAFSVDRDKAREKMRHFQLADPCAWLLEAVRAAVVMGASSIDVETDSDDVHVRFIDGAPFTREDVDEIYAALLAKNAPPARQHLAVALNAAMALGPRFVKLTTGDVVLTMKPKQDDVIEEAADARQRSRARAQRGQNVTTYIHVRQPFRAGAFVELVKSMAGTKREIQALRNACVDLDMPVVINGKPIQRRAMTGDEYEIIEGAGISAPRPGDANATKPGQRSIHGFVALDRRKAAKLGGGRIHVLHRGVLLEVIGHELIPDNITAVVEPVGLARDVSLSAFRRDGQFAAMMDAVLTKALAVSEHYAWGPMRRSDHVELGLIALRAFGDAIMDAELGRFALDSMHNLATALLKRDRPLRTAPLFIDVRGEPVSVNALCAEVQIRQRVLVSNRAAQGTITPDRLIVHARDDDEKSLLGVVLGDRAEDAEKHLLALEEKSRQRARFLGRRGPTTLPPDRWLARRAGVGRSTFAQGVKFELGLRSHGPAGMATTIFVDGCLACTKVLPCPFTGLSLAIEGRFALNEACDDIAVDEAFIRALREAWNELPALLADAVVVEMSAGEPSMQRQALVDHAVVLLGWTLDAEGLWRTFVSKVAEHGKALGTPLLLLTFPDLPPMSLAQKGGHPVTQLPMLRRVDDKLASMAELPQPIPVVPWEVTRCSVPHAIRSSPTLREVLQKVGPLEVLDGRAKRENRRAKALETGTAVSMPRGGYDFTISGNSDGKRASRDSRDSRDSRATMRPGSSPGLLIEVRTQARELAVCAHPYAVLGPLHAVVDDPDVLPLEDGSIPLEERRHYMLACLREVSPFLEHMNTSGHTLDSTRARARAIALALAGVLFPSPALRRAATELDIADYLALLELALTHGLLDIGASIELVMEASEKPTVAAIARVAESAGSPLSERAGASALEPLSAGDERGPLSSLSTGAWELAQRLAPFGGREGLLRARDIVRARGERGDGDGEKSGAHLITEILFACAPALEQLAFRTLDMRKVTPRDLLRSLREGHSIRFVERELAVGEAGDGVLVLSAEERVALGNLCGHGGFVDVTEELRKAAARRVFENRQVEKAQLDVGGHVLVVNIADEKIRGQVGLVALKSHATTTASVRVLRGGRNVSRHDLSSGAPCSFVAVIDDPDLPMNADFSAPASPGHMAKLFSLCIAAAEQGVVTCAEQYELHGTEDMRRVVLERLARTSQSTLTLKAKRGLASAKIFDTVAREGMEPDEIENPPRASVFDAKAAVIDGALAYVEKRPKKRLAQRLVLVLPTPLERSLAVDATGGPRLVDMSTQWEREDRLRAVRESLPKMPEAPADALVVASATAGRATLRAWLTDAPRSAVVHAGAEGLLLRTSPLHVPMPSFVAVLSGPDVVDDEWRHANIASAQHEIENIAIELGHKLLARAEELVSAGGTETDAAIRTLRTARDVVCRLRQRRNDLDPRWAILVGKASAAKIFQVADGAHISLEHALVERPASLEWFLRDAGFPPAPEPPDVIEARADAVLAGISADLARFEKRVTAEAQVPPPLPPPPSPEIVLSGRIAETMALVKLERDAEVELARWPIVVKKNGSKRGLVVFDKKSTVVDADHPLAKAALVEDAEPAALFMLSAAVYGAINAHLGEVTDDHERAFLARLIDHARTAR